jgi:N-acetylmuramoyl-L-alanine amidase
VTQIRKPILSLAIFLLPSGSYFLPAQTQGTPPPAASSTIGQPAPPPKPPPAFYRNLIVVDPAHGGRDNGAQLSNSAVEKDITLAFAQKLRPALVAQGFTVVATRDSDPSDELTTDQRAGTANHIRPLACITLHATMVGSGIHVVSSSLQPIETKSAGRALVWNKAQAPTIAMSLRLANEVGLALEAARLPVLLLRASVPPLDNLTCPAIAIEISPLKQSSGKATPVFDSGYQQRAVTALAQGLASFRTHNAPAPTQQGSGSHTGVAP